MIKFENVSVAFNGKPVFRNLDLDIDRGEKIVIIGKSGSGKSSLIEMVLGFTEPASGYVYVDGVPIDETSVWDIRKRVAYVDQEGSIGDGEVLERIRSILRLKYNARLGVTEKDILLLFDEFELDQSLVHSQIGDLSGGERQRVAIIISLLLQREIYLLDEVTSALDKHLKEKVAEYYLEKKEGTMIVVSHDPVWQTYPSTKIFDLEAMQWVR